MNIDDRDQADRQARAWDALISGRESTELSAEPLADIAFIQELLAVPAPTPAVRKEIWSRIACSSPVLPLQIGQIALSPNGHITRRESTPNRTRVWFGIWRLLAIGALAGFGAGFLAGIWTRLAMRLSGYLTIDQHRGLMTESEGVVGEITLAGTLSIAMFAAIVGILCGVLYVAIRQVLPGSTPVRAVSYGVLLLAVFGFFLMDENNPDYQLFGPPWLNVGTFSLTYIVYGVLVSLFVEALDARVALISWPRSTPRRARFAAAALSPFGLIGVGAVLFVVVAGIDIEPVAIMMLLLLSLPVLYRTAIQSPRLPRLRAPIFARLGLATVLIPGLFGVFLTTQGIVGILTS